MKKNVLILSASARVGGNSEQMAEAFKEAASAAGHTVQLFQTAFHDIKPCTACDACFTGKNVCIAGDDFEQLAPMLQAAEVLVLATPLYWYSFPAQLKAALDKLYAFVIGQRTLPIREAVLLLCGEIAEERVFAGAVKTYELILEDRGWVDRGQIVVPNVNRKGDVLKTDALQRIRQLAGKL